ncbi:hypothetical protein [Halobaculum sp. P14]|uniref:hypothetical protein n=1 Tax=Halobaculum sp. P14 TaxID=3421638 RepID=UPI003EB713AC
MSSGRASSVASRDRQIRRDLEPDVGPLDDSHECEAGHCDDPAVFAVPAPEGGDARFCGFHLAWFRDHHPGIWTRLQSAPSHILDDDPDEFAVVGRRFTALEDAPKRIRGGEFVRVALLTDGRVLYETADPDDQVDYLAVNAKLTETASGSVPVDRAGDWLRANRQKHGWLDCEESVRRALRGEEQQNGGDPDGE